MLAIFLIAAKCEDILQEAGLESNGSRHGHMHASSDLMDRSCRKKANMSDATRMQRTVFIDSASIHDLAPAYRTDAESRM